MESIFRDAIIISLLTPSSGCHVQEVLLVNRIASFVSQALTPLCIITFSKSQSPLTWNNYNTLPSGQNSTHFGTPPTPSRASLVTQLVKNPPAMRETFSLWLSLPSHCSQNDHFKNANLIRPLSAYYLHDYDKISLWPCLASLVLSTSLASSQMRLFLAFVTTNTTPSFQASSHHKPLRTVISSYPAFWLRSSTVGGFPGGTVAKNRPANAGDTREAGSILGSGRSTGIGNGNPLEYSCLGNPMGRGAWWALVYEVAKSQTQLSTFPLSRKIRGHPWAVISTPCPGEPSAWQNTKPSSICFLDARKKKCIDWVGRVSGTVKDPKIHFP